MTNDLLRALLFDMDGTLVNTEELKRKAHERTLKGQGARRLLELNDYAEVMGRPFSEVSRELMEKAGTNLAPHDYRHIWNIHYAKLVDEFAAAHEGALRLFKMIRERRLKIAIVSSSTRIEMERVLRKTGLAPWAVNLVSGDDVTAVKPSPEPYVKAMKLTFTDRDSALALEDTDAGCESALAAGLSVIGVRHELNARHRLQGTRHILSVHEMANPELFLSRLLEP
ncbi:MAG: HAD family phosphatase [Patescibacteria group bacterium]|jgi:beta-phosphoglucomutase-like phosphatase (HAD superfamily)